MKRYPKHAKKSGGGRRPAEKYEGHKGFSRLPAWRLAGVCAATLHPAEEQGDGEE